MGCTSTKGEKTSISSFPELNEVIRGVCSLEIGPFPQVRNEEYGVASPPADFGRVVTVAPPVTVGASWLVNELVLVEGLVGGAASIVRPLVPAGRGSGIITDSSFVFPRRAASADILESLTAIGLDRCQLKLITAWTKRKKFGWINSSKTSVIWKGIEIMILLQWKGGHQGFRKPRQKRITGHIQSMAPYSYWSFHKVATAICCWE
jgi:hypothetical protein